MRKHNKLLKITALALILIALSSITPYTAKAETVSGLQSTYSALESKRKKIAADLEKNSKDIKDQEKYQQSLSEHMSVIKQQIDVKQREIKQLNKNIDAKLKEINTKQNEIDETFELFKKRLKSMYMSGADSVFEVLLGSESFAQFVTRMDMMERLSKHDNDLISTLTTQREKLEKSKSELESEKKTLQASSNQLNTSLSSLQTDYGKSQESIDRLSEMEAEYKKNKSKIDADMQKIDREIKAAIAAAAAAAAKRNQPSVNYSGDGLAWPVPGFPTVTSPYGYRSMGFHTGMDIAGTNSSGQRIHGMPIIAANSGNVIVATSHWSYGNYILIDHGGGMATLYAHCSSLAVSAGQNVQKGQTIAYVGDTGNSYGSHLHFEVRINGEHRNPANYVSY